MKFEDYETLPTSCVTTNMTAGAFAGILEHCVMYPLDSVKTRMQNLIPVSNVSSYRGINEALIHMVTKEGIFRPVRGMSVVVAGAGPAHALYFSSYEFIRDSMTQYSYFNTTMASGVAGCISTLVHDGIMTPTDVVKQRLQMFNSPYKKAAECIVGIYRSEGAAAFYRSYTTQLLMNVPFQCIHFMTYEMCQNITNSERNYSPVAHMVSGAVAGGIAAAVTTPLDVCKTLLNTQRAEMKITGFLSAVKMVHRLGGPFGFFRGLSARVLFQIPSTAICWSAYEFFKYIQSAKPSTDLLVDDRIKFLAQRHNTSSSSNIPSSNVSNRINCSNNSDSGLDVNTSDNISPSLKTKSLSSSLSTSSYYSSSKSNSSELPLISSSAAVFNTFTLSTVHGASADNVTTAALIDVNHP